MPMRLARQIKFLSVSLAALILSACVAVVAVPITTGTMVGKARPWPAAANCPTPARARSDAAKVVALLNTHRAAAGLGPLRMAPALNAAAHSFACELASRGTLNHIGTDGARLSERLLRAGYDTMLIAENAAYGQKSPEAVVAAWMASPGHRANILRPGLNFVGVGQADGAYPFWVLDMSA